MKPNLKQEKKFKEKEKEINSTNTHTHKYIYIYIYKHTDTHNCCYDNTRGKKVSKGMKRKKDDCLHNRQMTTMLSLFM